PICFCHMLHLFLLFYLISKSIPYCTKKSKTATATPRIIATTSTTPVSFAMVFFLGHTILLNSALSPFNQLFFGVFSVFPVSPIRSLPLQPDYFVSLCNVCFLQNLQYFFVSILSGCVFLSFVIL